MSIFHTNLHPLYKKISTILVQFPPFFKRGESTEKHVQNILNNLDSRYRYVFEFRDNNWFDKEFLDTFFPDERIILGTTYMPKVEPFYLEDQSTYYIRMIGDRELTKFGHTQRPQKEAMEDLVKKMENLSQKTNITDFFVIFNNHFRGFALSDINEIKRKLDLKFRDFTKTKSLLDYM